MKRYEEYKDSGIEWIGEIPNDWILTKFKYFTSKIGSGKTPKGGNEVYADEGIVFVRSQNVYDTGLIFDDIAYITVDMDEDLANTRLERNDVLLNVTGASIGRSCVWTAENIQGNVNQHVCIIRSNGNAIPQFIHYGLISNNGQTFIDSVQTGANRQGLNFEQIANFTLPLPTIEEQKIIVAYLDHKTAAIDELITDKQKLVTLLQEKRTAIISEAITKGIDKAVKTKDSGVVWIGEIPQEWDIWKLKHTFVDDRNAIRVGPFGSQLKGDDFKSEGYKIYNQRTVLDDDFENGEAFVDENKFEDLKAFKVRPNDILVTTRGTIGRIAIAPLNIDDGIIHPCIIKFAVKDMLMNRSFLKYLFNGTSIIMEQLVIASNATTIPVVYSEPLKNICFPLPPLSEQQTLVIFLDQKTAQIDILISDINEQIEKLKEYRQAVISEAVTGKVAV